MNDRMESVSKSRQWAFGTLLLLILATVAIGFFTFWNRAQQQRRRAHCASQLNQLGKAINAFADSAENLGRFPMSLRELHPAYVQDPRLFRCPCWSQESPPTSPANTQSGEYLYFPKHTSSHSGAPVALCPHCGTGLSFNVLQSDGHVEWLTTSPDKVEAMLVELGVPLLLERGMTDAEIQAVQHWRARLNLPPADPPEPLE